MVMATLPPRLATVAALVLPGRKVADIGTDHGYLAAWLVASGTCPRAVASDRRPAPLAAAGRTVAEMGLSDRVELRLGEGLTVLQPGEVATAVLAGFGGSSMQQVLTGSPAVVRSLERLVLQPNGGAEGLRRWLAAAGWRPVGEDLVDEGGRLYVCMAWGPGAAGALDELDLMLGPLLRQRRHPLLPRYAREEYQRWQRALAGLSRARQQPSARLATIQRKAALLAAALQEAAR